MRQNSVQSFGTHANETKLPSEIKKLWPMMSSMCMKLYKLSNKKISKTKMITYIVKEVSKLRLVLKKENPHFLHIFNWQKKNETLPHWTDSSLIMGIAPFPHDAIDWDWLTLS